MAEPVKQIGQTPKFFPHQLSALNHTFTGVEFNRVGDANRWNEGHVKVACEHGTFFDDSFAFAGVPSKTGYSLEIKVDSWSPVPLWNSGRILLAYDNKTGHWKMDGYANSLKGRKWKFCNPAGTIDKITASLGCFIGDGNGLKKTFLAQISGLVNSLSNDKEHIAKTTPTYEKDGRSCKKDHNPSIADAPVILWD